jgi:N-acetylmuramoyl-L-alanine amidase
MGTLKRGNKGSAVILLQKQLSIKGYRGLTDGKFGVKTESNVKAFQTATRLKFDGIAGKQTKLKLFGPISVQKLE